MKDTTILAIFLCLFVLPTIIFSLLKYIGFLQWSWLMALSPLFVMVAVMVTFFLYVLAWVVLEDVR